MFGNESLANFGIWVYAALGCQKSDRRETGWEKKRERGAPGFQDFWHGHGFMAGPLGRRGWECGGEFGMREQGSRGLKVRGDGKPQLQGCGLTLAWASRLISIAPVSLYRKRSLVGRSFLSRLNQI